MSASRAPHASSGPVVLGRGWLWPAAMASALLAFAYLPAHGVRDAIDLLASTVAGIGLLALSLTLPRAARHLVLRASGPLVLIGSPDSILDRRDRPAVRRLLAVTTSAAVSGVAAWVAAVFAASLPADRSAHAISLIALGMNVWLLLGGFISAPPFGGWSLLLAALDMIGTPDDRRAARARRLGRIGVTVLASAVGLLGVVAGDLALMLAAGLLAGYGWVATSVAEADDAIDRFLARRQVGDLLRPIASQSDADDPIGTLIDARQPTEVSLVFDAEGLAGAIGPRQVTTPAGEDLGRACERVMVPISRLSILPASAPAGALLPQLRAHGFALGVAGGALGYIESGELLDLILLAADVHRRVERDAGSSGGGAPPSR